MIRQLPPLFLLLSLFLSACSTGLQERAERKSNTQQTKQNDQRPNILIIMADDMGFSDLGCFGSEIATPHLDSLAYNGLRFTQFYNAARCCPSRAALLTGQYPHRVGIGDMIKGSPVFPPAYSGILSDSAATLPEILNQHGYRSYMSGKWHLSEKYLDKPQPLDKGFQRYFGLLEGASSYWDQRGWKDSQEDSMTYMLDSARFYPQSDSFYMTTACTDYAMRFLDQHQSAHGDKPFFLYLAYQAPHWPLHAPEKDMEPYRGKYQEGWDKVRQERYANQLAMDLFPKTYSLTQRNEEVPPWDSLSAEEKQYEQWNMETYAGMITNMDRNIGRLINQLRKQGELDNTLILFLSDNGGCHEEVEDWSTAFEHPKKPGGPETFESYGPGWATVSNTPFKEYKSFIDEGGISTPFIVHFPKGLEQKGLYHKQFAHITDIMPTVLDLAGVTYPDSSDGVPVYDLPGTSFLPILNGDTNFQGRQRICWEHNGNAGIRKGKYKLVSRWETYGEDDNYHWRLYDMQADRSETTDISAERPELKEALIKEWNQWADSLGVMRFKDYYIIKKSKWRPYSKDSVTVPF